MSLALFDLDDTLVDRQAAFARWAVDWCGSFDLEPDALEAIHSLDRLHSDRNAFFEQVRRHFRIKNDTSELVETYSYEFSRHFEIAQSTIDSLRVLRGAGWRIAIVSNGPLFQMNKIENVGLSSEVDAICVSDLVGISKPDGRILAVAAHRCGVPLSGWMIGDSPVDDIEGATTVGLQTVWISHGRSWSATTCQPTGIASDIPSAVTLILKDS